jgi:hypothetical protein
LREILFVCILNAMERRLTRKQMEAFRYRIAPMRSFLYRCERRLNALGFTDSDKPLPSVCEAHRALDSLHFELHWEPYDRREERRVSDLPPPSESDF